MNNCNHYKKPLLSICIPTYNRADYLREALENITTDPAFGDELEVVISDNASTDHTQKIGEEYSNRYSNIHYFRNQENLKDGNFVLCLKRATGRYRKLSNDTLRYKPGTINRFITALQENSEESPILFYNNILFSDKNSEIEVKNINELINSVSYFIGWIATFGVWERDLECLEVDEKYTRLQFVQVAWILEILKKRRKLNLIFGDFYTTNELNKKAQYNLFKVHISNLSKILEDYKLNGLYYEIYKYRLFRYLILPRIYRNVYCKEETGFDLSGMWKILLKEYWFRPYIYIGIGIAKVKSIFVKKLNC